MKSSQPLGPHGWPALPWGGGLGSRRLRPFFSSRRRYTRCLSDWSSDVCSSDLSRPFHHTPVLHGLRIDQPQHLFLCGDNLLVPRLEILHRVDGGWPARNAIAVIPENGTIATAFASPGRGVIGEIHFIEKPRKHQQQGASNLFRSEERRVGKECS